MMMLRIQKQTVYLMKNFFICENIIEDKGYSFEGKHINIFKLKDGCKIKVSAS